MEGNDGETRFDFLTYKRTLNEAQGLAAIQNRESIKVDGKNIFPYQYENGGFKTIKVQKDDNDDNESLLLDVQGESKENPKPDPGRIANLSPAALLSPSSPLRSPNILIKDIDEVVEAPATVPLTISSVKLLPINDNIDDERYVNGGNLEIFNSPVKTGNSEFDIQMSPNRTKIVGGGGIIMRTTSPRMRSRRKSSTNGPKFIDTVDRGPVQSDIRLDLMVTSVANMRLKKSKKKKSRHKKHSHSRRSRSRGSPSPHRQRRDSEDLNMPKQKPSRGHRRRDKTLVTFEDKKKDIIENVETLQDRHHDPFVSPRLPTSQSNHQESHQQYSPKEGLNMPREFKRMKSLSNLGRSQAVDVSVDDEYGDIILPK